MKPKRGRPKLPKGEARSDTLRVRLTKAELADIGNRAKSNGKDLPSFIRRLLGFE